MSCQFTFTTEKRHLMQSNGDAETCLPPDGRTIDDILTFPVFSSGFVESVVTFGVFVVSINCQTPRTFARHLLKYGRRQPAERLRDCHALATAAFASATLSYRLG
jgi:hypothetical protein